MDEKQYLAERVDNQINWYDKKSQAAQKRFKWFRLFEIVAAASIPIIAGFGGETIPVTFIVALLGGCIAIVSAIISLNQYQEIWTEYRTTCETLQHEKFLYNARVEPYDGKDSFKLFVQRVEALISKEHSAWQKNTKNANLDKTKGASSQSNGGNVV